MIIRATAKTLNIARIAPVKNLSAIEGPLPGEWYVSLVPTQSILCITLRCCLRW